MADVTFRDFAGAIMRSDAAAAQQVLETLLALGSEQAAAATTHFRGRMAEPTFMPKAMSLRNAVITGTDEEIGALLEDCFGLTGETRAHAIEALRTRYPRP